MKKEALIFILILFLVVNCATEGNMAKQLLISGTKPLNKDRTKYYPMRRKKMVVSEKKAFYPIEGAQKDPSFAKEVKQFIKASLKVYKLH